MGYTKVDVNTNPIPASILASVPFRWPSGGGGGGGPATIIKISPVGAAIADACTIVGGVYPIGPTDLATVDLNLLGARKLLVTGNFQVNLGASPGPTYELQGNYNICGILAGVPFGSVQYTIGGVFGFYVLTDSGVPGIQAVGLRFTNNNLRWVQASPSDTIPVVVLPIVGNLSAMEFGVVP